MSKVLLISLAVSLPLTIVLEAGFFLLIGKRDKKDLLLLLLVNVITNPIVVLFYWLTVFYTNFNARFILIPLEIFAILTEGYYYKKHGNSFNRPYFFSFSANMISFGVGEMIQRFL